MKIALISTGGTIEKTYSELDGILHNEYSVLDVLLQRLQLQPNLTLDRIPLMNKDSLHLTPADRAQIVQKTLDLSATSSYQGIIIVHGTDTLAKTGHQIYDTLSKSLHLPIILTGAMRPYMLRNTDATQNLTEALLAIQILPSGVYVVMQNQILEFPGVYKDMQSLTFKI